MQKHIPGQFLSSHRPEHFAKQAELASLDFRPMTERVAMGNGAGTWTPVMDVDSSPKFTRHVGGVCNSRSSG